MRVLSPAMALVLFCLAVLTRPHSSRSAPQDLDYAADILHESRGLRASSALGAPAVDPLVLTLQFLNQLYNNNSLPAIDSFCGAAFVFRGCGVWLPDAPFTGPSWFKTINAELFQGYSHWHLHFLETAATAAVKNLASTFVFFHWSARNTGEFHGLLPTNRVTNAYGVASFQVDIKSGQASSAVIMRQGFLEERDVKLKQPGPRAELGEYWDVVNQPFWFPSPSLQRKMETVAGKWLALWNGGPDGVDALADIAMPWLLYIDGLDIWEPKPLQGVPTIKTALRSWLQQYNTSVVATTTVATPDSNKVFQPFEMKVVNKATGGSSTVRGVNVLVFNSWGWLTHVVPFRNGAPEEQQREFIGATSVPVQAVGGTVAGSSSIS